MGNFVPGQHLRQHADHLSPASKGRIGYRSHQPHAGPAIHQSQSGRGDRGAQCDCLRQKCRIIPARPTRNRQPHGETNHSMMS